MKHCFTFFLVLTTLAALAQKPGHLSLDSTFSKAMADYNQPGMAVGVVEDGRLSFAKGYGKRDISKAEEVNIHTVFQLASLSKAFTAACIGILIDQGKLRWEDKVADHLPFFKLYDPYVTANFTVRDLLCHRNGYLTFDGDLLWYGTSYHRREILRRFSQLPPKHGFREKYGYSNIMFIAAAVLVEEKSGRSWEAFVTQNIFEPLEMTSSFIEMKPFLAHGNIATPHVKNQPEKHIDYNNAAGAVGVNSSVADLSNWVLMWLNKGRYKSKQILKEATVREILSAHMPQGVSPRAEENGIHFKAAALGWMVQDMHGVKMAHHSGGLPGFILNIAMVPERNIAVIVLTNGETLIPFATTNYVLESFLTDKPKDWFAEYLKIQKAGEAEDHTISLPEKPGRPLLQAPDLVGEYEDKMYGKATVTLVNNKPVLTLVPTGTLFTSDLEFLHTSTYRIRFKDRFLPDGRVTFQAGSDGKVAGFTIDLPNPDFNFFNLNFEKKANHN